ncbi:hypothetical protein OSB04_010465 [Centaurea solstitialis]|uniref:Uncharacterized protein n=1 Tax=Centaurea solstitialis TaxID=347529 RepID=A0AA38TIE9_9ASTR|nr:hypothetical protein OSB04_010465 [Centaurea solstitialis]
MTTTPNPTLLYSPKPSITSFNKFQSNNFFRSSFSSRPASFALKCSNSSVNDDDAGNGSLDQGNNNGGGGLKNLLSGVVDETVEELLNREENRALLDGLDKATQRVELAKRELAEIQKQEIESEKMKRYINQLETRAAEIDECQKEISEARALVEEAERSLEVGVGGRDATMTETEREAMYKNKERFESVKAAAVSAIVGTLASLPISLSQVTETSQLLLPSAITLISCALFGVTFRYAVRRDFDNFQLKTGTSAAFGFVKGLATLGGGPPMELEVGSVLSHAFSGAVFVSENLLIFLIFFSHIILLYLDAFLLTFERMRNTEMKESGEIEREREETEKKDDNDHDDLQVSKRLQPWTKQITIRGIVASIILGSIYTVIAMKLSLTTGITPNLNVSAALLGFVYMKSWTKILQKCGISTVPFTRHENTMIQTCSVACYTIAIGGGFGSYLLALNKKTYEMAGGANSLGTYKELRLGWMTGYSFLVCFAGLFVLIPLRKILIVDYKLIFPSGMATAVLINGFHSQGDLMAKKQIKGFAKYFSVSFLWAIFQWFFTGKGGCGFAQFPTFGLEAYKKTFYFDFSLTYVGTGMICPHIVSFSLLLGAVMSWGVMWPLIEKQKGEWFPSNVPESSMESLNGYKVFISIALLLGDGLYNFVKILYFTYASIYGRLKRDNLNLGNSENLVMLNVVSYQYRCLRAAIDGKNELTEEERQQNEVFIREAIPMWVGLVGYTSFAILNAFAIPLIFPEVKWFYVIIAYIIAPSLAFCNAYGTGLTDWDMAYNYGKIGLFMMAALAGKHHGVVAGLAGCGLMKSVLYVSSTLMHDLKTGHLTLTSPRTMLLSQAIGTAIGCVVSPLTLSMFSKAFDVGNPNGEYKAPFAIVFRNMAIIGVQGFSALPKHCLDLCYGFFAFAVGINIVKDMLPKKIGKWMPLPICMAVPFLVGGYFSIDMCIGSLVLLVWGKLNAKKAELMATSVASGLICGEGLWILPGAVLSLAKIKPPMCMKFLSS